MVGQRSTRLTPPTLAHMSAAARQRLLWASVVCSAALAFVISALRVLLGRSPYPAVELATRPFVAFALGLLLLTRRRWAGWPLALLGVNYCRWFVDDALGPALGAGGRGVAAAALLLQLTCVLALLGVRPVPKHVVPPNESLNLPARPASL
jgi:hypothetical protein